MADVIEKREHANLDILLNQYNGLKQRIEGLEAAMIEMRERQRELDEQLARALESIEGAIEP